MAAFYTCIAISYTRKVSNFEILKLSIKFAFIRFCSWSGELFPKLVKIGRIPKSFHNGEPLFFHVYNIAFGNSFQIWIKYWKARLYHNIYTFVHLILWFRVSYCYDFYLNLFLMVASENMLCSIFYQIFIKASS